MAILPEHSHRANVVQGLLLTMVPWVLKIYGPKIRARSRVASVSDYLYFLELGAYHTDLLIFRG